MSNNREKSYEIKSKIKKRIYKMKISSRVASLVFSILLLITFVYIIGTPKSFIENGHDIISLLYLEIFILIPSFFIKYLSIHLKILQIYMSIASIIEGILGLWIILLLREWYINPDETKYEPLFLFIGLMITSIVYIKKSVMESIKEKIGIINE